MHWGGLSAAIGSGLLLASCANYEPHPLAPETSLSDFQKRQLDTPQVRSALGRLDSPPPDDGPLRRWNLMMLTAAALELSPELAVVRAEAGVAQAGIRTAGARPNPTLGVVPEYAVPAGPSPWIVGAFLDVPLETAGKRRKRMDAAGQAAEAARWAWAEAAWQARSRVRAALVDHLSAQAEATLVEREAVERAELLRLSEHNRVAGEASMLDVAALRAEHLGSQLAVQAANTRVVTTRTTLARAIGVPVDSLDGVEFDWPGFDTPAEVKVPTEGAARTVALLNRADVQRSLAEYAGTEAVLRLEIARQYPDIHLNPGYTWDQTISKYALGVTLTLPLFDQNQGPISEAQARRAAAEARFLALQARVIGETESAVAGWRGALAGWNAATEITREADRHQQMLRRALELGETDRLVLAAAEVQALVFARSRVLAGRDAQLAVGLLEDALERPVTDEPGLKLRPLPNSAAVPGN